MNRLEYSIVIPTGGRAAMLADTLESIASQTRPPKAVYVISNDEQTAKCVAQLAGRIPVKHHVPAEQGAAAQRNAGAELVDTPLIAFVDDDMTLEPDVCEHICEVFEADAASATGGVAARMRGHAHPPPRGLLWWYYRIQAGFSDPTYGARLFGPAINCFPTYHEPGPLIPADWLNSACVFYRTDLFKKERFPAFEGYSYMEDVHLSARIARTHRLFFHASAICEHRDGAATSRRDLFEIARMRMRNQRIVAREILNLRGPVLELKLMLHRVFASVAILRRAGSDWRRELAGTWR